MQSFEASSHMTDILMPKCRGHLIDTACRQLSKYDQPWDGIAVCGASGMLLGSAIADRLNKNLVLVRKPNDSSHSNMIVEGSRVGGYFIADDLICSGFTLLWIVTAMKMFCEYSKCQGIFLSYGNRAMIGEEFISRVERTAYNANNEDHMLLERLINSNNRKYNL